MRNQPVPAVSPDDVERIVRRDFPEEQFARVMDLLNEYGTEKWERERFRVQLATLRMAHGSLETLRRYVGAAKQDYRDVLASAEYPEYSTKGFRVRELSTEEQRRIMDADWKQYGSWLQK
ncbi:MAG: hypothetical protein WCB11_10570 [Terriglobales bacterium]|jgi:hypothetical protein